LNRAARRVAAIGGQSQGGHFQFGKGVAMIRMNIVKWVAASALAVAAVPAIGMARHTHTVSATVTPSVLTPVKHTLATKGKGTTSKLVSHKKATPSRMSSRLHTTKHTAKHRVTKKSAHKTHSKKKH
jgi:hypothetical protein